MLVLGIAVATVGRRDEDSKGCDYERGSHDGHQFLQAAVRATLEGLPPLQTARLNGGTPPLLGGRFRDSNSQLRRRGWPPLR